ncbi:MAG: hypothetical protein AAB645_01020 [Patescibacteria group bacterium]
MNGVEDWPWFGGSKTFVAAVLDSVGKNNFLELSGHVFRHPFPIVAKSFHELLGIIEDGLQIG